MSAVPPEVLARNPHLRIYLEAWRRQRGTMPEFVAAPQRGMGEAAKVDLIYPLTDPLFVHIHKRDGEGLYQVVQPSLDEQGQQVYRQVREKVLLMAPMEPPPASRDELAATLERLFQRVVGAGSAAPVGRWAGLFAGKVGVPPDLVDTLRYALFRDVVGHGPLQPLLEDANIEDIHCIGVTELYLIHKVFGNLRTNLRMGTLEEMDEFFKNLGERVGRPVSESNPIIDATLGDGSRLNLVYSTDVSKRGPSFTVRKFNDTPLSIVQIIKFGALSAQMAAYLWLCLENGMSIFVCGETASGKTTALNAVLPFVPHHQKVYTAEDTAEVIPPHEVWQQLVTRERGPVEGRVQMFDLLKAALRSRPNYIIVGEIRGAEGAVAFQAMQTGHPCLATFHASSVGKMIQRLGSDPINVPKTFMDNLNVACIQMAVYRQGKLLRRMLAVEEIEGFNKFTGGVETRRVFEWDAKDDRHVFRGMNNSFVLEDRIADKLGYADRRQIYQDLRERTAILQALVDRGVVDYKEVVRLVGLYQRKGLQALPFPVEVPA